MPSILEQMAGMKAEVAKTLPSQVLAKKDPTARVNMTFYRHNAPNKRAAEPTIVQMMCDMASADFKTSITPAAWDTGTMSNWVLERLVLPMYGLYVKEGKCKPRK